jgi:hypothetical protein
VEGSESNILIITGIIAASKRLAFQQVPMGIETNRLSVQILSCPQGDAYGAGWPIVLSKSIKGCWLTWINPD